MTQRLSVITINGNPVAQISLLPPGATALTAPKSIDGAERQQIMLCDPLTGLPLNLQGGTEDIARNVFMGVPADGTIDAIRVMFDFTLTDVYTKTTAGTTLVTVYKNGAPLDAGITTSSVENHQAYTTDFAAGDQLSIALTTTAGGCAGLEVALGVSRDLE